MVMKNSRLKDATLTENISVFDDLTLFLPFLPKKGRNAEKTYSKQGRIQDFSDGGENPKGSGHRLFWAKFPENCMKIKKIGPRVEGARPKFYYVDKD